MKILKIFQNNSIIVPPQVPKITDQDGNYLSGLVGPYNEGDELALTCLTKGGKCLNIRYLFMRNSFYCLWRKTTTIINLVARFRHHWWFFWIRWSRRYVFGSSFLFFPLLFLLLSSILWCDYFPRKRKSQKKIEFKFPI